MESLVMVIAIIFCWLIENVVPVVCLTLVPFFFLFVTSANLQSEKKEKQ